MLKTLMLKTQLNWCFLFLDLLGARSSVIAPGKNEVPPSRSGSLWKHLVLERRRGGREGELTRTRAASKSLIAGGLCVPIPVSYEPLLLCHFLWPSSLALCAWLCVIIFAACLVLLVPRPRQLGMSNSKRELDYSSSAAPLRIKLDSESIWSVHGAFSSVFQ